MKCVPPIPKEVQAYCREGRNGYQLSQTDQPRGMAAVIVRGSHNLVSASETIPRTTVEPFRTGVESLVDKSFLEPVMATERSEMMFVLTSARDFCSLK